MSIRSLLFAGATRPDLVAKLPRSRPDACVIDLEDAVPETHKDEARSAARALADELASRAPSTKVFVRVNPVSSRWFAGDVAHALTPSLSGVVLPKLERRSDLADLRTALGDSGLTGLEVIAGIESATGVLDVRELLEPPVTAVYFGAEDYVADLGGRRTACGDEVLYARSRVALATRAAGVASIDQAVVDFDDDAAFIDDARRGRDLGYLGKICIHPRQVELAHRAFDPDADELDRDARMLESWRTSSANGTGALEFEGRMVDEPALRMARERLGRAAGHRREPGSERGAG